MRVTKAAIPSIVHNLCMLVLSVLICPTDLFLSDYILYVLLTSLTQWMFSPSSHGCVS